MNINQLETLITLSKTMSFRKAGELLNLTQPAVSAQIKNLEDEFKTVLIHRNQPVTLTENGQVFLEHAVRILHIVADLKQKLIDLKQVPQGNLVLGTTTSIAIQILPRVLSYFQDQFPLIKTKIVSMSSSRIITQIENGSIDIGISYLDKHNPNLVSSALYYDAFELVVSPNHPLAVHKQGTVEMLQKKPFIMLSPDTLGRQLVDKLFQKHNIQPHIIMELSSSEEVKRMVELNIGVAIISKLSASTELRRGSLQIVPLPEWKAVYPVGVIYRADRYVNSAVQHFLRDVKGMPLSQFTGFE